MIGSDVIREISACASALGFSSVTVAPVIPAPGSFPAGLNPVAQYRSPLDQRAVFVGNRTGLTGDLSLRLRLRQDRLTLSQEGGG